jgi:beta-galactosidase
MKAILSLLASLIFLSSFAQRDTIDLNNDWLFKTDKKNEGMQAKWFEQLPGDARSVQLPHTWNIEDENQHHYGLAWYQRKFSVPAAWKNKELVLQVGAINHTSIIFLNGKNIFENKGDGYNKFFVNLTGKLIPGKENLIAIMVNNEFGKDKVPYGDSFDWPNDGGIIRPISLIVSGKPSAAYLHLEPKLELGNDKGKLTIKLGLPKEEPTLQFRTEISEEGTGKLVYDKTEKAVWQNGEAFLKAELANVKPWHFDFPELYRVSVSVIKGKNITDKVSAVTGFRDVKMSNGQFFLNGEAVKLMGVEWTAGSNPNFGFAEPAAEIIRMGKLMKDVNCIFTRQHFQQDEVFYDFCDRNGILIQQELPLWGHETPSSQNIRDISMLQLERMISNLYNHPSIFSWGVGNELRGRDPEMKNMIEAMLQRSKELDPGRAVAYVSNTLAFGFINQPNFVPDAGSLGDYIMMNEYGGSWWDLPTGKIHAYLDSIHMSYPDKTFFISEFGLCEPNFKGGDERRIVDLAYHMAIYETKPFVQGAIYFDLTDYRTHYPGTKEAGKFRRRVHGIYDMYGNPKPSMKTLRELTSPIEVQQLTKKGNGKLNTVIFGNIGLPQHITKGYKLYVSDKTDNYLSTPPYALPELRPGQRLDFEIDDKYNGEAVITITRPNGYVVSQTVFFDIYSGR